MSKRSKEIVVIATALLTVVVGICTLVTVMLERAAEDEEDEDLEKEFGTNPDSEKHEDIQTEF